MCSFTPDLETIKRCAAEGKYSVYPVSAEMLSDMFTPLRVLSILKNVSTHVYMLESVSAQAEWDAIRSSDMSRRCPSPVWTASLKPMTSP